jgi:hypothetical protein
MANARAPSAFAASAAAGLDESRPRLIDVAIERDAAIGVFADLVAQMIGDRIGLQLTWTDWRPLNGA